jgi:2-(3-amino-3-carboxypropyl)histidine synthase
MFIHAKSNLDVTLPDEVIKKLPAKVGLLTSIQLVHKLPEIQKQLPGSVICGQVLGCNSLNAENKADQVDAFLFIGSGIFHPIQIAWRAKKPVFVYNPATGEFEEFPQDEVEKYLKRRRGSILKFLDSKNIGVVVSTKIGQLNLKKALELEKRTDKNYYVFVADTLEYNRLEDFNFIDCWVNTSCPRIADEKAGVVNINDLTEEGIIEFPKVEGGYEIPIWMNKKGLSKTPQ